MYIITENTHKIRWITVLIVYNQARVVSSIDFNSKKKKKVHFVILENRSLPSLAKQKIVQMIVAYSAKIVSGTEKKIQANLVKTNFF